MAPRAAQSSVCWRCAVSCPRLGIDLAPLWYHFHADASLCVSFNEAQAEAERRRYHGTGSAGASKEAKLQRCIAAASAFIALRRCFALCSSSHFLSEGTEVNQLTPPPSSSPLGCAASLFPKSSHIEEMHYGVFFPPCNVKSSRAHIGLMSLHDATIQRRTLSRFSSQLAIGLVSGSAQKQKRRAAIKWNWIKGRLEQNIPGTAWLTFEIVSYSAKRCKNCCKVLGN